MVQFFLFKAVFENYNCFLSSVATNGKDGRRLKLQTIGPPFSYLKAMPPSPLKITSMYVLVLPDEIRFISS